MGGWTETRPVSLGLLPSGSDPVGEWCVHRQPPSLYLDHAGNFRKLRERKPAGVPKLYYQPPDAVMMSPVSHPELSEARKTAIRAMSSG